MTYDDFLNDKICVAPESGFEVSDEEISSNLKPHQREAVKWACKGGRRALFESFGLGKTVQELEFCRLVIKHEGGKLPATFMMMPPASWSDRIWDDINRMRTLNTAQSQKRKNLHVCPLQLDIVERIINRYSNENDLVLDPFGGLMTVPYMAVKMKRRDYGIELNEDYFRDGVGYLKSAEMQCDTPTLFDYIEESEEQS